MEWTPLLRQNKKRWQERNGAQHSFSRFSEGQDKTRQEKTREDKRRQEKTREDKTRQDKTRQGKTRQGKARQGKARQGKAPFLSFIWGLIPSWYIDCFPNNLKLRSSLLSYL